MGILIQSSGAFSEARKPVVTATTTTLPPTAKIQPGANLVIPKGQTFDLTQSLDLGRLTIDGTLRCAPNVTAELKANVIFVNGLFECGASPSTRFLGNLKIALKHSSEVAEAYRGMVVSRGGVLRLHGRDNRSGFVKLDGTVNPGNRQRVSPITTHFWPSR